MKSLMRGRRGKGVLGVGWRLRQRLLLIKMQQAA